MDRKNLLDPFRIGDLHLPNRLVMAPLTRCRAGEERMPNALMTTYYRQRASAGLIIAEATVVNKQGIGYRNTPGIYNDAQMAAWKSLNEVLHQAGGRIFLQLWHMGRISHPSFQEDGQLPVAPSAIAGEGEIKTPAGIMPLPVPRAMETQEVEDTIRDYKNAARLALQAGFDGIELHAANGYLPEQFLNDGTNRRTDKYGGSPSNRRRFILEILDQLIEVWGENKVGIRLSPSGRKFGTVDSDPVNTYTALVEELNKYPLAYLHLVEPLSPLEEESRYLRHVTPHFRKVFKGPLITCGGYTPSSAQHALQEGWADLVAFGRPFIANPDLPERIRQGGPLNQADPETFYTFDSLGYTDYPFLKDDNSSSDA